jgi:transposase-like protein
MASMMDILSRPFRPMLDVRQTGPTPAEAAQAIGAARYERTDERVTHRNGSRTRLLNTKAGDVELHIPKFREGSFLPTLLEPRRRIDRALWAVVMEACVHGVSTRKVDDLVRALGIDAGISKSEVSRICAELDAVVAAFRERRLDHTRFPYVFLDATYVKAHEGASVVSKAIVIATGWTAFARGLRARGLSGVRLVISDAHQGLKAAIATVFLGAAWQRCRVHFLRNVLARIPRGRAEMVLALIRTIWAQPDPAAVREQLDAVADKLSAGFPVVAAMLAEAREDVTAFAAFPFAHWKKIWSTNPLERVNKEIKRRSDVVGIFLRVLLDSGSDRSVGRCRMVPEGPRVTRNLSVEPPGSDLVRASPLGPRGWPRDLIAA